MNNIVGNLNRETKIFEFEVLGASRNLRKFKVIPEGDNKVAFVLYLDVVPKSNIWSRDDWQFRQFSTEAEFANAFGNDILYMILGGGSEEVRLAMIDFLTKAYSAVGRLTSLQKKGSVLSYSEARRLFSDCVTVNRALYREIFDNLTKLKEDIGDFDNYQFEFDCYSVNDNLHFCAAMTNESVCNLLRDIEYFLASCDYVSGDVINAALIKELTDHMMDLLSVMDKIKPFSNRRKQ